MWSYRIDSIKPSNGDLTVQYTATPDGNDKYIDTIFVSSSEIRNVASDERKDYIKNKVMYSMKKFMVIEDVKYDFDDIIGVPFPVEPIKYETKAEMLARVDEILPIVKG